MNSSIRIIRATIKQVYQGIFDLNKELATEILYDAYGALQSDDYLKAFGLVKQLYVLAGLSPKKAEDLFNQTLFAEDVIKNTSVLFVHKDSLFAPSINQIAANKFPKALQTTDTTQKELGESEAAQPQLKVLHHNLNNSFWTKDYLVAIGDKVITPIKSSSNPCDDLIKLGDQVLENTGLYYGALQLMKHHKSKTNVTNRKEWEKRSTGVIESVQHLNKTVLEGGNFFCAMNSMKQRFYIIGENVVSETMRANAIETRKEAITLITQELKCTEERLLILPQWTYHLDLQMSYLGRGQFIIHSFKQNLASLNLDKSVEEKVGETFKHLENLFEQSIIDTAIHILQKNGFSVNKVFGCLFYINNIQQVSDWQWVPYCKASEDFEGAIAQMMNGIAIDYGDEHRFYLVARCSNLSFKKQFANSLQELGVLKIFDVDMPSTHENYSEDYEYDDDDNTFNGMAAGVMGAQNLTQLLAFLNGGLRCQTAIISQSSLADRNSFFSRRSIEQFLEDEGIHFVGPRPNLTLTK